MSDNLTPMMKQYRRIKGELPPGVILFFRLGDFYEMFYEDAKTAAPVLEIALTRRNNVPMCGIPFHAADGYLAKMIRAGLKVAICDQIEEPSAAKGIVRRDVTRIVTPGTATEAAVLAEDAHNFLASVYLSGSLYGLAWLDLSTGLFRAEEIHSAEMLADVLKRIAPMECVVPEGQRELPALRSVLAGLGLTNVSMCEDWTFDYDAARETMIRHFQVHSLEGFGCEGKGAVVGAAGAALHYVREDLRRDVGHVRGFQVVRSDEFLILDEATIANLDLVPGPGRAAVVSLFGALDATRTCMGRRKLRDWVLQPLARLESIVERHDAVEAFVKDRELLRGLREALADIRDLERLIVRLGGSGGNARDAAAIGLSLTRVPPLRECLGDRPVACLQRLVAAMTPLPEIVELIERAIVDEPPATVREGGLIRTGFCSELDDLRTAATQGRQWLAEYQSSEQQRSGIKTLKVRHNKVFGYYIEISKAQLDNVPEEYTRKQTLVNAERFITPELKEYEAKIMNAHERAVALEYEKFCEVRDAILAEMPRIQATADAIAEVDALASLADRALSMRYVRPVMSVSDEMVIKDGRHAVIEQMPEAERFVPNDTLLDGLQNQVMIITGPNMAGKSTYIRQVALIAIMAHMGSFVPASEARIGIVDRVFTRVGASDDLARGRSTFLVEMQETANILNNATPRSLIVLDEIGRGTSTFDGISIAWAVAEHLHNNARVKAKTLFATHYHELTDLALTLQGVKNYNVLVREKGDHIAFLRKIAPGGADKSYGIQVARLAGLPVPVVDRAKEILANLEEGEFIEPGQPKIAQKRARRPPEPDPSQMNLFG